MPAPTTPTTPTAPTEPACGWAPDGRTHPYRDPRIPAIVVSHHGPWLVGVIPTSGAGLVVAIHRDDYPRRAAVFRYRPGGAAGLAAGLWNPLEDRFPQGFLSISSDTRPLTESTKTG